VKVDLGPHRRHTPIVATWATPNGNLHSKDHKGHKD
jgi:hypothetical protein